eukprot:6813088-Karenia_brevis.AAC.1
MNETAKHSLDIFQLKGLRKILKIKTTFVDRVQDTRTVYAKAQRAIHEATSPGKPEKIFKPYSEVYDERKTKLLNKIIKKPQTDPIRAITFQQHSLVPIQIENKPGVKRRSGQPRVRWVETALARLWTLIGKERADLRYSIMNLQNEEHIEAITWAAGRDMSEFTPTYIERQPDPQQRN